MHRDVDPSVVLRRPALAERVLLALAAALPLVSAACSGGSDEGGGSTGCTIVYAGGAAEAVWCDAPAVRASGPGYVLWVMAFRGPSGLGADQAGQLTLSLDARPEVDVDYGFSAGAIGDHVLTGFMTRTAASETTHEATVGGVGALTVRFSSVPATDGPDPGGWDGIGTVHGTFTATLVSVSGGADVTATGSF